MGKLPSEIKLTVHARERLEERKDPNIYYNTKNLMKSSCKWYTKDDFIPDSKLYLHSLYVCRKSSQMAYITDGNIEVLYNKHTGIAITIMEVKEKFLPITQYIKEDVLNQIKKKKENKKMNKTSICPDCGREEDLTVQGICKQCYTRKAGAKTKGKEYIPYIKLSEIDKRKIDNLRKAQAVRHSTERTFEEIVVPEKKEIQIDAENYYQRKAEQSPIPVIEYPVKEQSASPTIDTNDALSDRASFISILKECGCDIPDETLKEILSVLISTDKLKDIFMTIVKNENQDALLNLEHMLNVAERKLQHNWEYNGFQEIDDIKFKGFLSWRRMLKSAIYFWKKLYSTSTLLELQKAWNAYTVDPNEKVTLSRDRTDSILKRYQITTESISTILNTRKPFTRVFYATSKEDAYERFLKWMSERQLHENKNKTTIVELTSDGVAVKKEDE